MRITSAVLLSCLAAPTWAQVSSLDRALIGLHYFHDYEPPGQMTVNVTSQGNGLSLLRFDQTFNVAHGGQSKHVGELSSNPNLPYHAPSQRILGFQRDGAHRCLIHRRG
jgi:hypothetical protein